MRIFFLFVFFLFTLVAVCQTKNEIVKFDSVYCSSSIDELRSSYSFNKEIPSEYELSILMALSHFPELDSANIKFKETKIKTTLNARPTFWSTIFNKKGNRKYIVRINSKKTDSIVKLSEVSFNARIGLFGHEFCHFIDYNEKGFGQLLKTLTSYSNKSKREEYEKEIDAMTIEKGLGWQLYEWSNYVLTTSNASEEYKKYKSETYLKPGEIEELTIKTSH